VTRSIVDGHAHVWNRARTPIDWIDESLPEIDRDFSVAELEQAGASAARRNGVEIVGHVLVQALNDAGETDDLLRTAHGPVVGWVDIAAAGAGDVADADGSAGAAGASARLQALREGPGGHRLAGIRHLAHVDPDPEWMLAPAVARGLDLLAAEGLTFDLVVRPWQLPMAVTVADAHPGLRLVLDHLGQPPAEDPAGIPSGGPSDDTFACWQHDLAALARRPNVVAKISGVATRGEQAGPGSHLDRVLTTALDAFGPSRLMFGSDWPLVRLADDYPSWLELYLAWSGGLSVAEQHSIDSATARQTYGDPA
jgi:L-fuconolactonase